MADISKIQVGDTTYNLRDRNYCTCSTGASTADKTASLDGFVLTTGSAVKVKFTNTNTAANPTLNINSTGAKPIMQYGTTVAGTTATESWDDGAVVEFVYDGTNWVMQGRNTFDAVSKSAGGTFDGDVVIDDKGTTTSSEVSILTLGNSTATGTVGNSNGMIRMYGQGDKYVQIRPVTTSGTYTTDNRTIMLPDESGTIALNTAASQSAAGLMSAADKTKLDGIEAGANAYTLPTAAANTLGGVKVGTNLSISNGVLSATDTTYSAATTSAAGLMSAADKTKLNGIATGANAYSLPIATASALGGIKVGTNLSINASTGVLSATNTTYSAATTSAAGLMSAADKTKLNGIAAGANAYSLPTASSSTLGGIKVGTNLSISNGVLSATNTTYSNATTSAAGLMSAADKTKLNAITPYPTAYSTSGNWKRLTFSNKLQILWCTQSVTIANINTAWGGGYEARIGYWTFPWAFNAVPTITAALQGCSGGACILEYTGAGSATSTQTYYAWRPTTGTNITVTVGITAFGTYT